MKLPSAILFSVMAAVLFASPQIGISASNPSPDKTRFISLRDVQMPRKGMEHMRFSFPAQLAVAHGRLQGELEVRNLKLKLSEKDAATFPDISAFSRGMSADQVLAKLFELLAEKGSLEVHANSLTFHVRAKSLLEGVSFSEDLREPLLYLSVATGRLNEFAELFSDPRFGLLPPASPDGTYSGLREVLSSLIYSTHYDMKFVYETHQPVLSPGEFLFQALKFKEHSVRLHKTLLPPKGMSQLEFASAPSKLFIEPKPPGSKLFTLSVRGSVDGSSEILPLFSSELGGQGRPIDLGAELRARGWLRSVEGAPVESGDDCTRLLITGYSIL